MSAPYQIASLIPDGLPARTGVERCHRILAAADITIDDDSLLLLADTGTEEPEPAAISDGDAALRRLIDWPTLGSIDYAGPEGMVTVSYLCADTPGRLTCVLISPLARAVERTNSVPRYQQLATRLHRALPARRTIMAWGLEDLGFSYTEELARLRAGRFTGDYELLDLRAD